MAGGSTRVVIGALLGNAALAAAKFVAAAFSGSGAIFAEAVHSVVQAGNHAMVLVGMQRMEAPPDPRHPYGHGNEIYFWAFVAAILVYGVGAGVALYEGVHQLRDQAPLGNVTWSYVVIGAALVFEVGAWTVAWREFSRAPEKRFSLKALRQSKNPALSTLILEDGAAVIGLLVALVGIFCADRLGWFWADGLAALAIGAIMAATAIWLAYETRGLLIGEASNPSLVEDIIGIAGQASFVEAVNEVRTLHFGPADVLVNLSVDARDHLSAGEVEGGISRLEGEIRARHPEIGRVFIEIQSAADGVPDGLTGGAA